MMPRWRIPRVNRGGNSARAANRIDGSHMILVSGVRECALFEKDA
mgnify:CR=1 FL=1